jgi:glycine betaine catabolism B
VTDPLSCHGAARYWDRENDADLTCVAVRDETHDVRTFTFASRDGHYFAFRPGQYFSFDVPVNGGVEQRCYSISSSPLRPRTMSVTVKRVPGGLVSNWLHDTLKPGDAIRGLGPLGVFVPPADPAERLLLVSGGSGITPMMAMVRAFADAAQDRDVVFLHAARSLADFAFRDDLRALARALPRLRVVFLPEAADADHVGLTGRIDAAAMRAAVPDFAERLVMCCGPAPFMAAVRDLCDPARYVEESFDAAGDAPAAAPAPTGFSVTFSRQNRTITVGADQPILAAARGQGVVMASSCANGICGTCKSKLVSGQVAMNHNGGIRQREIDAGMILPCCAVPLSDLVIER